MCSPSISDGNTREKKSLAPIVHRCSTDLAQLFHSGERRSP
jgi:hypothetical protein